MQDFADQALIKSRNEERNQVEYRVGAIASYPTATYCAWATIRDGRFHGFKISKRLPTKQPENTFAAAESFFADALPGVSKNLDSLAISFYGLVDSKKRKFLGSTQEQWKDEFDVIEKCHRLIERCLVEEDHIICLDDNAAGVIAEHFWGSGNGNVASDWAGRSDTVYFKVLDGIGSGIIVNGRLWNNGFQPELGHLPARRIRGDDAKQSRPDNYAGACPRHRDCIEGLGSRAALTARLRYYGLQSLDELENLDNKDHDLWRLEAYYLAQLAVSASMVLAPRKIIFEGDFISADLMRLIKLSFADQIAGYPKPSVDIVDSLIVESAFNGADASLFGALELARQKAVQSDPAHRPDIDEWARSDRVDLRGKFQSALEAARANRRNPSARMQARRDLPTLAAVKRRKIFGLSIAETVQWGIAEADAGVLVEGSIIEGTFADIPESKMPLRDMAPIILQPAIRDALLKLYVERPELFDNIDGIGVSAIGIVDPDKRTLETIARKNWLSETGRPPLVNFSDMFLRDKRLRPLFPKIKGREQIVVQNDAPARCLAEYHAYKVSEEEPVGKGRPRNLMYLMVGEGVNGAIVHDGELPHMLGHPELGHQLPIPHPRDLRWNVEKPFDEREHTGCPRHYRCFEGVASSARIRLQWGFDLWELPGDHIAWEVEAFYLSQMAMNAVLTLDPDRIIFGGHLFHGRSGDLLLEKVRFEFIKRNAGYLPKYSTPKNVEALIGKAQFEMKIKVRSALTIGCIAAFSSDPVTSAQSNMETATIYQLSKFR